MDAHRLRQLVIKDDLTELYNRRYFKERLREEKRRGDLQGLPFSLLILDVDHFKEVNDYFGHPTGDKVLVQVAKIISESVREIDISCRYAGDEFVVILPGALETETEGVIKRIVGNLNTYLWEERAGVGLPKLTCSVGYSCYPEDARELPQLIKRADHALYWAKNQGRDRWIRWKSGLAAGLVEKNRSRQDRTLEMVGRVREREKMMRLIERVESGSGCPVLIEGEMGVGKSRLVQYALMILEHKGFEPLVVNCFKEMTSIPYFPLREVMSYLEDAFKEELSGVLKAVGTQHRLELSRFYPSLAEECMTPDSHEKEPDSASEQYVLFESFLKIFTRLSRIKPLVVVVENVQWADFATRKLLNYLSRAISSERILLLATRRTGRKSSLELAVEEETPVGDEILETIELKNLSRVECDLLAEGLLGREDLPRRFLETLYKRTAGNPLFVEEMIKYLDREPDTTIEQGTGKAEHSVPDNVAEMLKGQVDTIQEEKRSVLSMASVLGVEFGFDMLMLLTLKNEGYLLDVMDEAVKQRIIRSVAHPSEDRYTFVNPLFRQVLYEGINKRRRRNLHKQIGKYLEKYYQDRIEELYGDLALHFQQAGDRQKALEYTIRAGEKAKRLYANREAIHYFDSAIEIITASRDIDPDQKLHLQLMEEKGDVHDLIGEYDNAQKEYEKFLESLPDVDNQDTSRARVIGKLGLVTDKKGDSVGAIKRLEEGLKIINRSDDQGRAQLLGYLADMHLRNGDLARAGKCCEDGLNLLSRKEESAIGAHLYMSNGCVFLEKGEIKRARYHMSRGIEILDSVGDNKGLGKALLSMGTLYYTQGKYRKAEEFYERSRELATRVGNVVVLMACDNNLGMIARVSADFRKAISYWEEGLDIAQKIGHHRYVGFLKNNLGNAHREVGDYPLARKRLEESLRLFRQIGSDPDIRRVNRGLAIFHLRLGDLETAERIIRQNLSEVARDNEHVGRVMSMDVLGRILKEKRRYEEAEPLFLAAVEGYRHACDPEDLSIGLLNTAEMYICEGATGKALPFLDEGERLSKKIRSEKLLAISCCLRGRAVLKEDSDPARAVRHLKKAQACFDTLELPHHQIVVYHALGMACERLGKVEEYADAIRRGADIVYSLRQRLAECGFQQAFEEQPIIKDLLSRASGL